MENGKEQQYINRLPYLPISSRIVIEALKGKSAEQLSEIGITGGLLFMIRQGYAKKLREDVFNKLSQALDLDISADTCTLPACTR